MKKITDHLVISTSGLLELFVLKMLSTRTYSPKEIAENLKRAGVKSPMGTIYPVLKGLRHCSYVSNGHEESETGGSMKTYDITQGGRHRLTDLKGDWKYLNSLIARL
jgi:DNA-binding PadR family transcriptional regulator